MGDIAGRRQADYIPVVGVVGGGQLARMMIDAAPAGVDIRILAEVGEDPVADRGVPVERGSTTDLEILDSFARTVDVVTFDHELVPIDVLLALEARGHRCAPSAHALRFSHKAFQRTAFAEAGIPIPPFAVVHRAADLGDALQTLGTDPSLRDGIVAKASSGGYDGRGVIVTDSMDEVEAMVQRCSPIAVVLEPRLAIAAELAVLVVSDRDGQSLLWDPVDTVQAGGMCAVASLPSQQPEAVLAAASEIALRVAGVVRSVGVLAVEFFVTESGELLVNEIAPRPHNSGHITIDAAQTSQFENHIRAVAGLALGPTGTDAGRGVMINIVGDQPADNHPVPEGVHTVHVADGSTIRVHRYSYSKQPRPSRKIGHVNFWGEDAAAVGHFAANFVDVSGVDSMEMETLKTALRSTFARSDNRLSG